MPVAETAEPIVRDEDSRGGRDGQQSLAARLLSSHLAVADRSTCLYIVLAYNLK